MDGNHPIVALPGGAAGDGIVAAKGLARRYVEAVLNGGELDLIDELVADDHVNHSPLGHHCGLESIRRDVRVYRTAFPDLRFAIEELIAEGDRVVRRFSATGTHRGPFLGRPPSGRFVAITGVAINRLAGGKLAETWLAFDLLDLLRQLGVPALPNLAPLGAVAW